MVALYGRKLGIKNSTGIITGVNMSGRRRTGLFETMRRSKQEVMETQTFTNSMTTKDSSKGTRLLPSRAEKVHLRGFTSSRPTPQDSQPQSTLAANSDSLWIFPHLPS